MGACSGPRSCAATAWSAWTGAATGAPTTRPAASAWHATARTHNPFHRLPGPGAISLLRGGAVPRHDDLRALLRDHTVADWRDVLPRIDVPVLAIAGRQSPLGPCESSEPIAAAAPDGRCVVLDDCGHVPFLEQPERFEAALLAFLR